MSVKEGTILNERYKLVERIGVGGMASVFMAEDAYLGRKVAIKMLHEGLMGDDTFVRQFQREAHSAANLSHPNIVTVHDLGQHDHRAYIVMEYVEGRTLKQIIQAYAQKNSFMPLKRVLDLIVQICHGIGYAHRSGLVHCDVKPQNVLVTTDRRVKVTDFGIARAMSQATGHNDELVWGTPQYFSPEQAAGDPPTPASDVYSIGIIMFEMLTNQLPFSGGTPTSIALQHLQAPPPSVRSLNPYVPREVVQIINKILSKEPSGRYRTAGQLGRILSTFRQQTQNPTREFTPLQAAPPVTPPDLSDIESSDNSAQPPQQQTAPPVRDSSKRRDSLPQRDKSTIDTYPISYSPETQPDRPSVTASPSKKVTRPVDREAATQAVTYNPELEPATEDLNAMLAETEHRQQQQQQQAAAAEWQLIALGILAAIAILGLIPLWYFVAVAWGAI